MQCWKTSASQSIDARRGAILREHMRKAVVQTASSKAQIAAFVDSERHTDRMNGD